MTLKKKDLAIYLSRLQTFPRPSARLEQYATDSELAAQLIWHAALHEDIQDKVIADLGCGTGILGIGALLLGAKQVFFVDVDFQALALAQENLRLIEDAMNTSYSATFLNISIEGFHEQVDVILQNPPFGVQQEHADRLFLTRAMAVADVIYTIHKIESTSFIASLAQDHGFRVSSIQSIDFPLKKTQPFHRKKVHLVPAGIWRLERYRKV